MQARSRRRVKGKLVAGLAVLVVVGVTVWVVPWLFRLDPYSQDLQARFLRPGQQLTHPLGTDQVGRDVLARLLVGGRVSALVGLAAAITSGVVGTGLGIVAGYFGGYFDSIIMRLADVQLAFPVVLFAIMVLALFGPTTKNLVLVLAISQWVIYARTARAEVLALREKEFVEAALSLGASHLRILLKHVLPNIVPSILVIATVQVGHVIILESSFSFLGLGVQPPTPSWGGMLETGRTYMTAWWMALFPGLAITFTVLGVNLFGEGLGEVVLGRRGP